MTYNKSVADLKIDYFSNTLKDQEDIAIIKDLDLTRVVTFTVDRNNWFTWTPLFFNRYMFYLQHWY